MLIVTPAGTQEWSRQQGSTPLQYQTGADPRSTQAALNFSAEFRPLHTFITLLVHSLQTLNKGFTARVSRWPFLY